MAIKELREEAAQAFLRDLQCPECKRRATFNGTGQSGIWRVFCYYCEECDTIYQLIIEKRGVPMVEEVEKEGRCTLEPDKTQNKCNVCACGLYSRSDPLG